MFAEAYREEARKFAALPATARPRRLLWTLDVEDWFVLCLEHVESRQPRRPVAPGRPRRGAGRAGAGRRRADPAAGRPRADTLATEFAAFPGFWDYLPDPAARPRRTSRKSPRSRRATRRWSAASTLVHTDVRDDNVLHPTRRHRASCATGTSRAVGADWVDSLIMLVGPRGDGLDVEAILASRRLLRDVPAESIDIVLALVTGYFLPPGRRAGAAHFAAPARPPALAG